MIIRGAAFEQLQILNTSKTHQMKKYTVYCQDGRFFESFTIEALNHSDATEIGRRQCRKEGIKFLSVRIKK